MPLSELVKATTILLMTQMHSSRPSVTISAGHTKLKGCKKKLKKSTRASFNVIQTTLMQMPDLPIWPTAEIHVIKVPTALKQSTRRTKIISRFVHYTVFTYIVQRSEP